MYINDAQEAATCIIHCQINLMTPEPDFGEVCCAICNSRLKYLFFFFCHYNAGVQEEKIYLPPRKINW